MDFEFCFFQKMNFPLPVQTETFLEHIFALVSLFTEVLGGVI